MIRETWAHGRDEGAVSDAGAMGAQMAIPLAPRAIPEGPDLTTSTT